MVFLPCIYFALTHTHTRTDSTTLQSIYLVYTRKPKFPGCRNDFLAQKQSAEYLSLVNMKLQQLITKKKWQEILPRAGCQQVLPKKHQETWFMMQHNFNESKKWNKKVQSVSKYFQESVKQQQIFIFILGFFSQCCCVLRQ